MRHGSQDGETATPSEAQTSPGVPSTLGRIQEAKAADAASAALVVEEVGPNAGMASEALRGLKERAS